MKKLICLLILVMMVSGGGKNSVNSESEEAINKLKKEGYDLRERIDENRAFGDLDFGDDVETVNKKMKAVVAIGIDVHNSGEDIWTGLIIGENEFVISPKFYQGKLYAIDFHSLQYDDSYRSKVKPSWEAIVKVISDSYGPADIVEEIKSQPSTFKLTHIWNCGKKKISIGLSYQQARCLIEDLVVIKEIETKK